MQIEQDAFSCPACKRQIPIPFGKEDEWIVIQCDNCSAEYEVFLESIPGNAD